MSDIRNSYSDYVRYFLKADNTPTYEMLEEPGGWVDDDLELDRHKKYHGIFTKFSNKLEFYREAKDYIVRAYHIGGVNMNLRLIKQVLRDVTLENGLTEVKWIERYNGIADFKTYKIKGNVLQIQFNSNDLAELIKTHESDDFEIEREDSIDEVILDKVQLNNIDIEGRIFTSPGVSKVDTYSSLSDQIGDYNSRLLGNTGFVAVGTEIVSQGASQRHSRILYDGEFDESDPTNPAAGEAMFFRDNIDDEGTLTDVNFTLDFKAMLLPRFYLGDSDIYADIVKYSWNGSSYDFVEKTNVYYGVIHPSEPVEVEFNITMDFPDMAWNEGLMLRWRAQDQSGRTEIRCYKHDLVINVREEFETSYDLSFIFAHDLFERLTYILTGQKNKFYSKFYGRVGLLDDKGEPKYEQDGLSEDGTFGGGLIGIISGFWIRAFDPTTPKYKSLKISLKDLIDSSQAVFNTGVGIETVDFKERLRVEELKYFYREEVIIRLPFQVSNEERKVDATLFQSATTTGYSKGGGYEDEIGLDEPNTQTTRITPIRKSKNKYSKLSKIRGDDTAMELTRRFSQARFPEEDTERDEHNWWLDLIRNDAVENDKFRRAIWQDRVEELPTGIGHAQSWRGMIFTPLRMMFRHGWVLRSGLEPYLDKFMKYINGDYNSTVKMQFPGEQAYAENQANILVSDLDRARVLPMEIKFNHPVDEDLIDLVFGTTSRLINGSYENIPNFYFKFEWINEDGVIERGYLKNLKPKKAGSWTMIKANENLIR